MRIAQTSLAIVMVTIATVLCLRLTPAAQTSELRDRLATLEQQVQQLNRTVATPRPEWPARETTTELFSFEPASAASKQVRIREDQTAFDES